MLDIGYKEAVRTLRKRKGLTQEQCAARIGMKDKNWSKYETGAVKITEQALARLRKALQCTKAELFYLALPYQRAYHNAPAEEIREDAPEFGTTPAATRAVRRLLALNEKALPAGEQHWFKLERDHLAALLARAVAMAEDLVEKYLYLIGKARRAQDEEDDKNRKI